MHNAEMTFNCSTQEQADQAIVTVWNNGGFVRRTEANPLAVEVVADSGNLQAIRSALDDLANPTTTSTTTPTADVGA